MNRTTHWPVKTREIHNHHFDSTIWNDFDFRHDDIVIGTYAKSGTTWMQQIVLQLLFKGEEGLEVAEMSPWLDLRAPPKEIKLPAVAAQTFVHKGTNGRWREVLTPSETMKYEQLAQQNLGEECARWLATGEFRKN